MIEKSDSTSLALATIAILGQAPREDAFWMRPARAKRQMPYRNDGPAFRYAPTDADPIVVEQGRCGVQNIGVSAELLGSPFSPLPHIPSPLRGEGQGEGANGIGG